MGEEKQLTSVACAALDRVLELAECGGEGVLVRPVRLQRIRCGEHRLEVVVELMGDAPREHRDRLQLLSFTQLLFQLNLLGDIASNRLDLDRPLALIADRPVGPGEDSLPVVR